jgi:SAM-dependent methyltransferase
VSGAPVQPFDAVATGYDASFTDRRLGRWLRDAVRERLAAAFASGSRVLELGCGTGEDAVWLAGRGVHVTATDSSAAMLEVAREKAKRAGVAERVSTISLDLRRPADAPALASFDGAFANFGALNCVGDRRPVEEAFARWVRPGGALVLVVMGPVCAWEIAWHLAHAKPRQAFRRLRGGAPAHVGSGATVRVWYPSPRRLRAELAPWFRHRETAGVGVLLPPPYLDELVERHAEGFARIRRLERRIERRSAWLADHYVGVFERR